MDTFFHTGIDNMYVALDDMSSSRSEVIDGTAEVGSLLQNVKAKLDALACGSCPDTSSLANVTNYSMVINQFYFSLLANYTNYASLYFYSI